jgi:alpha-soluble NSF attachment protein
MLLIQSEQAEKTLSSASGGFSFFGGREDKFQNAADLYVQAGNAYKMQKLSKQVSKLSSLLFQV